jgi:hypothetical protein
MTPELAGMKAMFAQWGIDVKFVPANYTLPDDF